MISVNFTSFGDSVVITYFDTTRLVCNEDCVVVIDLVVLVLVTIRLITYFGATRLVCNDCVVVTDLVVLVLVTIS